MTSSNCVLVTGGAGYVGSHAAKALARAGYTPVTLDNLVHGHREFVNWGPLAEGDIGDRDLVAALLRKHAISAVIHLAGFAYVGESVTNPLKYFDNNVARAVAMLQALIAGGVGELVFSSTCAVYGNPAQMPISENVVPNPITPYGRSKLMFEEMLRAAGDAHGLRWTALRYFNAAGADPDGEIGEEHDPETHLIPLAIRAALDRTKPVSIFGTDYDTPDGTAIRDYIHVADLASAHVLALNRLANGGASGPINLGVGRGYSVREVIKSVERVKGTPVAARNADRRRGDPPRLVADPRRAREEHGWKPNFEDLDGIVRTAWTWHTRQQERPLLLAKQR